MGGVLSSGPSHVEVGIGGRAGDHHDGRILAAVARASLNFVGGAGLVRGDPTHLGPDGFGVSRGAGELDAGSGFGGSIDEKPGGSAILGDGEIDAAVLVEVSGGCPALFAVDLDSGIGALQGFEMAIAEATVPPGRVPKKFWARNRSTGPSPSKSAATMPKAGDH